MNQFKGKSATKEKKLQANNIHVLHIIYETVYRPKIHLRHE